MTTQEIKNEILERFENLEKLAIHDVNRSFFNYNLTGQLQLSYDFENEKSYDDVLKMLQDEGYESFRHNFELCEGLNVMILMN